jgi:hypothetical protein
MRMRNTWLFWVICRIAIRLPGVILAQTAFFISQRRNIIDQFDRFLYRTNRGHHSGSEKVIGMKKQVIEHAGVAVGIIVPDRGGVRFIAVKFHVYRLNDRHFNSASEVHRAIDDLTAEEARPALAA